METTSMARSGIAPANRHRHRDGCAALRGIAEFVASNGDGTNPKPTRQACRDSTARSSDNDGLSKSRTLAAAVSAMPKNYAMRPRRGPPVHGTNANQFIARGTHSQKRDAEAKAPSVAILTGTRSASPFRAFHSRAAFASNLRAGANRDARCARIHRATQLVAWACHPARRARKSCAE